MELTLKAGESVANKPVDPEQALVLLRSMPLLRQVPEEYLKKIAAALKTAHFGPGESIVQENDVGARLYIIWRGEAKVISPYKEGAIGHNVSKLRCGDYFGLDCSRSSRKVYQVNVLAINEVTCLILTHEYSDLLSASSVWDYPPNPTDGPTVIERVLELETLEVDLFRNIMPPAYKNPRKDANTFGGQSIAQALRAASMTVDQGTLVHSLHAYFLRPGIETVATVYQVQRTRDGQTFATRHVQALQRGRVMFVMYASFKRPTDQSFEHMEQPMSTVPDPEEVEDDNQRYDNFLTDPRLLPAIKEKYSGIKLPLYPLETRSCDPADHFQRVKLKPRNRIWFKSRGELSDDQALHRCVIAYASDTTLLSTGLMPHPESAQFRMQALSLDHSMWFHQPVKADEWLLYECESPVAGDGRALTSGRIYNQAGELVVSVAQEGMIRKIGYKAEKSAKL